MEQDFKREAIKQYLKYFRIWFIVAGALTVIGIIVLVLAMLEKPVERTNGNAPTERVYDNADVLSDKEENDLREYIAECESIAHVDIVLVTIREDVESKGISWDNAMMNYADDFYDHNSYGFDKIHGDGVLLLDNWYEGQGGSWLSTCGSVYERFGNYEIDTVLDEVYFWVEDDPYEAYKAYVTEVTNYMSDNGAPGQMPWMIIIFVPLVVALIYAAINLHQKKAEDTTTASTYLVGGTPDFAIKNDTFIRKSVVKRRIETSSGSSGGSRSRGGRGGSHRSSSGVSHGGGGRRR